MRGGGHYQLVDIDAASDDLASGWTEIKVDQGGSLDFAGPQVCRVMLTSSATGANAGSLGVALVRAGVPVLLLTATVTPRSQRAATDMGGVSGRYLCDVSFAATSTDKFDMLGMLKEPGSPLDAGVSSGATNGGYVWMIGMLTMGDLSDVEGVLFTSPVVG